MMCRSVILTHAKENINDGGVHTLTFKIVPSNNSTRKQCDLRSKVDLGNRQVVPCQFVQYFVRIVKRKTNSVTI